MNVKFQNFVSQQAVVAVGNGFRSMIINFGADMHIADTEMAANNAELQMPTFA